MRNMLAFVAALVLAAAGLGWYLGWYHVRTEPARPGHRTLNIDINTDKVGRDLHRGEEQILDQGKEKLHDLSEKGKQAAEDGAGTRKDTAKEASPLRPLELLEEHEFPIRLGTDKPESR